MPAIPKPTKLDRQKCQQDRKAALKEYRRAQAALAISRDGDQCAICYFVLGKHGPREDVHHVYGRGRAVGDWREHHSSLLCTCRKHHPQPIKGLPGSSTDLYWVEGILEQAVESPINLQFSEDHNVT